MRKGQFTRGTTVRLTAKSLNYLKRNGQPKYEPAAKVPKQKPKARESPISENRNFRFAKTEWVNGRLVYLIIYDPYQHTETPNPYLDHQQYE